MLKNKIDRIYEKEAFRMLRDAAEKGDAFAQLYLGFCYSYGIGIVNKIDKENVDEKAIKWLRRAAKQGYRKAHRELRIVYGSIDDDDEPAKQPSSDY